MRRVLDPHVHLWDLHHTPRKASPAARLLGWRPELMLKIAPRLFARSLADFVGRADYALTDYLPADHSADAAGVDLAGFVHVQAGWEKRGALAPVGETRWLESLETPMLRGIVGYADLALGDDVRPVLAAHCAASPRRFRGVRYHLAHHPERGVHNWCDDPARSRSAAWRRGYAALASYDLRFDVWIYQHQLPTLIDLVRDVPEVPVVLDHMGGLVGFAGPFGGVGESAAERRAMRSLWEDDLAELASYEHVALKVSGMTMPMVGLARHDPYQPPSAEELAEHIAPWVEHALACFGVERCMFASNFPMDKVTLPWQTLFDAFALVVANRSDADQQALFHDNAVRIYDL